MGFTTDEQQDGLSRRSLALGSPGLASDTRHVVRNPKNQNVSYRYFFDAPIQLGDNFNGMGVRSEGDGIYSIGAGLGVGGMDDFHTTGTLIPEKTQANGWTAQEANAALEAPSGSGSGDGDGDGSGDGSGDGDGDGSGDEDEGAIMNVAGVDVTKTGLGITGGILFLGSLYWSMQGRSMQGRSRQGQ